MIQRNNIPIYGVTEFNLIVKNSLESNFSYIKIRGEISEIKSASKGQLYLSIKDENSILSAVVWENKINLLKTPPEVGMEVVAHGKITTWSRYKTTYQLDIDNIEIAGEGALLKLIEERKKRLAEKGMFEEKYKKKLPFLPNKIGIITSSTGSVIHDIINRLKERFPLEVDLWPVSVQGNKASEMIINAIIGFNEKNFIKKPEVLIIARGGGSVEDLMAFNDENLAYAVFNSKIPIVSAIGHETDTPLIDFVSDLRAPTPTAAAEIVVPLKKDLISDLNKLSDQVHNLIANRINDLFDQLDNYKRLLKDPRSIIHNYEYNFRNLIKNLNNAYTTLISDKKNNLKNKMIKLKSPSDLIKIKKIKSENLLKNLNIQIKQIIKNNFFYLDRAIRVLQSNALESNLKKGYVLLKKNKNIIKRSTNLTDSDNIQIKFFDKPVNVKIKKIN